MSATLRPHRLASLASVALMAALMAVLLLSADSHSAQAQVSSDERVEAQAQSLERQLLCPVCTNERLDVCGTAICVDMKRIIRERLVAGATPDDIMLYFEQRYGAKVRAQLPAEGFNLWLYGWIGGAVLAVGGAGAWFLLSLRRRARPAPASIEAAVPTEDAWLDEQIARSEADEEAPR